MAGSHLAGGLYFVSADPTSGDLRYDGLPIDVVSQIANHLAGPNADIAVQGYFNHFYRWEGPTAASAAPGTGGWIYTETAAGAGNAQVVDVRDSAQFGILRILTDNGDNDRIQIQLNGSAFRYVVGRRLWFGIRCAPQTAASGELGFGLILETDTDMVNTFPTEGIFFEKAETAVRMDFHVRNAGVSTERTAINSADMANDVMHEFAFLVDRAGAIRYYYDGTEIGVVAAGNANIPTTEDLTLAIQVQTGTATQRYIDVDYVYAFMER